MLIGMELLNSNAFLSRAAETIPASAVPMIAREPVGKARDFKSIIEAHWEAMAALEIEKVLAFYTEDFSFSDPTMHINLPSKAQVREALKQLQPFYANVKFTPTQIITGTNWAVAQHIFAGSYKPPQKPEAGFKEFSVRGVSVFEFAGAKFKRQTDYYDALKWRKQVGLEERS